MYASSIKPSLHYFGPLWPPSFLISLAPTLQSRSSPFLFSRCNLSFISVELHGEESFVAQKFQHVCKFEMHVYLRFRSFNLNFRYMASCTYADRHTHASCNVVKLLSAKVLLQCAVISVTLFFLSHMFIATVCRSEPHLPLSKLLMFNIVLQSLHDI